MRAPQPESLVVNRRDFLGISLGAGVSVSLTPELLRALHPQQQGGKLIQRAIPSTGERLPVIGLGFANHAGCADPAALKAVLTTFVDNGGRVFDTQHQNDPKAQQVTASIVNELGVQDKLFLSLRGIPGGGGPGAARPTPEAEKAHLESLFSSLKVPRVDLVVGFPDTDPTYWALLKEAKKDGRIRYLGTMVTSFGSFPRFESVMRNEPLDFITVDYCIDRRGAEEKLLPLAQQLKIAVLSFFPFGGANGLSCVSDRGVFGRIGNRPLPEWAAEFDASTWAQFCLKYVVSHPAITTVRVGTTKAHHMLDNIGGGIGRLPDEAMRKRMAELIESFPLAVPAQALDRYAGEYTAASGLTATFRRDGETLFVKSGTRAEAPLVARTFTRFVDPEGSIFEFQLVGVGPATRAASVILEQGGQKIPLERK
jgi:aryl-alcohol dehydrogenase-like predicted oxidoreductase